MKRSRNFAFVLYPDSAPDDWQSRISDLHLQAFVSPLHDSDINPDGELKKPHYHVLIMSDAMKSDDQISCIVQLIGGVGREIVQSARGYARYLCHLDNPEKHQYDTRQVLSFGGADYTSICTLVQDEEIFINDIIRFIYDHEVTQYNRLYNWCHLNRPEWARLMRTKYSVFIREYIKSYSFDLRTHGHLDFDVDNIV